MLKPGSLRAHLTAALPELARDPEKLVVLARAGRTICTGTASLSFEYAYTLQVIVLDYAGHADAVVVPLLAWVARNQPELLDNPDKPGAKGRVVDINLLYTTLEDFTADPEHPTLLQIPNALIFQRVLRRWRAGTPVPPERLAPPPELARPVPSTAGERGSSLL